MCDERERLIGYVYGEGDDVERQRVSGHVADCEVCREEIGGLRRVREDLLAWEVPAHDSVWKPFAPERGTPWWREVPGWAMAAAASLTFVAGAAGGLAANAVFSGDRAMAAGAQEAQVVPAGISEADLAAFEQRVVERLQADLVAQQAAAEPVTLQVPVPPADAVTADELAELERWVANAMQIVVNDLSGQNERINEVEGKVTRILTSVPQGAGHQ